MPRQMKGAWGRPAESQMGALHLISCDLHAHRSAGTNWPWQSGASRRRAQPLMQRRSAVSMSKQRLSLERLALFRLQLWCSSGSMHGRIVTNVRFTAGSRHRLPTIRCPFSANNVHDTYGLSGSRDRRVLVLFLFVAFARGALEGCCLRLRHRLLSLRFAFRLLRRMTRFIAGFGLGLGC